MDFDDNGVLYIGGEFSGVNGVSAKRLARYTPGIGWEEVGGGVSGSDCTGYPVVNVVKYAFDVLYVGGKFSRAGEVQSHGYAIYDMSVNSLSIMPDTFDVLCDSTVITGMPGFSNWQWSTGDTGSVASVNADYFDSLSNDNGRVWVYATAEKNGCVFTDSIEVAYIGFDAAPLLDYGSFDIGDSTYLYFKPAYDTTFADYDIWIIDLNIFLDHPSDTVAIQMPCEGSYEASVRIKMEGCGVLFWQFPFYVSYTPDRELILPIEIFEQDCEYTVVWAADFYTNYMWSNGVTDITVVEIDEDWMQGEDRKWLSLTADSTWTFIGEDYTCSYIDSVEIVRWENYGSPIDQDYSYVVSDSFRVDFTQESPGDIYESEWDYGDGQVIAYSDSLVDLGLPFTHYYPGPGTYTVQVISNSFGCVDSLDTVSFEVLVGTTGFSHSPEQRLDIYPNPSDGAFSLAFPAEAQGLLDVKAINSQGQKVFQHTEDFHAGGSYPLELSILPDGIYLLQIQLGKARWTSTVVIR